MSNLHTCPCILDQLGKRFVEGWHAFCFSGLKFFCATNTPAHVQSCLGTCHAYQIGPADSCIQSGSMFTPPTGTLFLRFDTSSLLIPDLNYKTASIFGIPIPPPLNIAITPVRLEVGECRQFIQKSECRKVDATTGILCLQKVHQSLL